VATSEIYERRNTSPWTPLRLAKKKNVRKQAGNFWPSKDLVAAGNNNEMKLQ